MYSLSLGGLNTPSEAVLSLRQPEARSYPPLRIVDDYLFIGYDADLQLYMNSAKFSWAVQYEITRLRSLGHYNDIEDIKAVGPAFEGPNQMAPLVLARILQSDPEILSCSDNYTEFKYGSTLGDPYEELEKEEQALEANPGDGLSLESDYLWHGGKGTFVRAHPMHLILCYT